MESHDNQASLAAAEGVHNLVLVGSSGQGLDAKLVRHVCVIQLAVRKQKKG